MATEYKEHEIGEHIRIFEHPHGGNVCIITAHGGYEKANTLFRLSSLGEGLRVCFYNPHGTVLADPGLQAYNRQLKVVEEFPRDGDELPDYILTKYQGRHSKPSLFKPPAETYDSIRGHIRQEEQVWEDLSDPAVIAQDPRLQQVLDNMRSCHIVTIRNRFAEPDIKLQSVIRQVVGFQGLAIREFHCMFCRSLIGYPWSPSQPTYVATK